MTRDSEILGQHPDKVSRALRPFSKGMPPDDYFHLPAREVGGVEMLPLSYRLLASLAVKAQMGASHAEKRLRRELLFYLRGLPKLFLRLRTKFHTSDFPMTLAK